MRPVLIAALLFGSSLGAALAWQHARPRPAPALSVATAPASPTNARSGADALAAPPLLTPRQTGATLAVWLALPRAPGPRSNFAARAESLRALLARLPASEFPRLLDAILRLDDDARDDLRRLAFDAWVDLDPAAAARWAATAGAPARNLARQAAKAWALRDPLAALAWTTSLADDTLALDLAEYAADQLPPADLPRALALIEARGPVFRDALAATLFRPLAKTDPAAAVRAFGPAMWRRDSEIWQLDTALAAWARTDLDGALVWLSAQPRVQEFPNIVARLGDDDASRARLGAALLARADFPVRQATLGELLSDWVEKSPVATLAWLDTVKDSELRDRILARATRGYSAEHPEADLPLVLARAASPDRDSTIAHRLEKWAEISPQAALAWIATQTDASVAKAAPLVHGAILGQLAVESPEAALREWNALSNAAVRTAALGPIVEAWSRSAPEAALRWGTENLIVSGGTHAEWQIAPLQNWASKDPAAALSWIESHADEKVRQGLFFALGGHSYQALPPDRTAQLYSQIRTPALRADFFIPHLKNWLMRDRPAAKAWIEKSDALTPEQAAALLAAPAP